MTGDLPGNRSDYMWYCWSNGQGGHLQGSKEVGTLLPKTPLVCTTCTGMSGSCVRIGIKAISMVGNKPRNRIHSVPILRAIV